MSGAPQSIIAEATKITGKLVVLKGLAAVVEATVDEEATSCGSESTVGSNAKMKATEMRTRDIAFTEVWSAG
jgi:hypothetical protein